MAGLSTCTSSLNTCDNSLSSCNSNLSVAQACGNGVIDSGEQCDQSNLNGQTCASQGFAAGVLKCGVGCMFNTSGCSANRFIDNGDGTVSDLQTGLMWEKKDNLDGDANYDDPHDAENLYTWSVTDPAYDVPTGTVFTDFLYKLNNCTFSFDGGYKGGFAGHCDWRLPTRQELKGIIDPNAPGCAIDSCQSGNGVLPYSPCIDPVFGATETFAQFCSGDVEGIYWTITNQEMTPGIAVALDFSIACVSGDCYYGENKFSVANVRAVRSPN
jgi:hypothetical protein